MKVNFSTKAGTLVTLRGTLSSAAVPPSVHFQVKEWKSDQKKCLDWISKEIEADLFIVRSSCGREDGVSSSNAGAFLSLANIDALGLVDSIEKVIDSYKEADPQDEVLVQPMLQNVVRSGVAFSHDPNTCSPYRVINWTEGDDTAVVTGGLGGKTWQQAASSPNQPPEKLAAVVKLIDELLSIFDGVPVDCEFAVTQQGLEETLWLLQARPLILKGQPESIETQANRLTTIYQKIRSSMQPHPFLGGKTTVYGVMPDWNPAEIIGIRPKPLALSLYRELVTDSIWAYQRDNYGYRNLRSFPLMPHFFGLPYIDVRLSFNSFIPADLDDNLADRLVDYYLDRLVGDPALHDKVEFDVVHSCYTLDLPQRLERLAGAGFREDECRAIAISLRNLTNRIVNHKEGLWRLDANKLDTLEYRRKKLLESDLSQLDRIYWLIEDMKRYGTLPFAGLARAGFVAVQILKSFVTTGVFSQSDYDSFIGSISTVSSRLARDRAVMTKSEFLDLYGHLRPGTYDITSPRYDASPDLYFDWEKSVSAPETSSPFSFTLPQMRELTNLLDTHGLQLDPGELFDFLEAGIELRESAKFRFTRNLSDVLELIAKYGHDLGISRDDLSYCDINVFKELHITADYPSDVLLRSIENGKKGYEETLATSLPSLIVSPEDVWAFESPEASPNFITQKQTTAPVAVSDNRALLEGRLICIPNADPGYDWLFSYPIAGLITAWGGANSHMAIRAGELGLPAVIGAGEALYTRWSSAERLHVDCAGRRVEIVA